MLLIFNPQAIAPIVEEMKAINDLDNPIMVYVYSDTDYPQTDSFSEVLDKVKLVALPESIRRALKNVMPKIKLQNETKEN